MRDPGSACSRRLSTAVSWLRTAGELTVLPAGTVTTGTTGALSPPVPPNSLVIVTFVSQPSLPGTENFWSIALVAEDADAMPIMVRPTQKRVTILLCARTQRVIGATEPPSDDYFLAKIICSTNDR